MNTYSTKIRFRGLLPSDVTTKTVVSSRVGTPELPALVEDYQKTRGDVSRRSGRQVLELLVLLLMSVVVFVLKGTCRMHCPDPGFGQLSMGVLVDKYTEFECWFQFSVMTGRLWKCTSNNSQ